MQEGETGVANDFGMLFEKESNGCQLLPSLSMPATKSAELEAALVNPSGTEEVYALAAGAIAAVSTATATNQHADIAWAHYFGDAATCTSSAEVKAATAATNEVCEHTPAALVHPLTPPHCPLKVLRGGALHPLIHPPSIPLRPT